MASTAPKAKSKTRSLPSKTHNGAKPVLERVVVPLPERIGRLDELAFNLWWSWHEPARALFRSLSIGLWESCEQNPVLCLRRIEPARLEAAAHDAAFLTAYDRVLADFDAMLAGDRSWVARNEPALAGKTLAYFSAEFGLHWTLPIYSGGLGVLAGDHVKEASDLGLPLVGVSLLYRQGYLRQRLSVDGWQLDVAAEFQAGAEPMTRVCDAAGQPLVIEVALDDPNHPLRIAVWQVKVGRNDLFLLDSDVEGNPDWTRTISSRLYGGDREHRLRQEIILGIGGVRALQAMGLAPDYWHANEGHAAFHLLERLREYVGEGLTFAEAADRVRAATVFTTHTPVPAGHDIFGPELMDRYFGHFWPQLVLDREAFYALGRYDNGHGGGAFNLTALSLRLAGFRNGVSARHAEITRQQWNGIWPGVEPSIVPITAITNGVHLETWLSGRVAELLDRYLPAGWREEQDDPLTWEHVRSIPDREFWEVHLAAKQDLIDLLDERSRRRWAAGGFDPAQVVSAGPFLDRSHLTIGFARRFATYKRATLLFHDLDRLAKILNDRDRPVQIVFAGKAHPADDGGKRFIQEIYQRARDPRLGGRIAFAEDYDMYLASYLVSGVDVWLNNPRAPMEASGTSGMKAAINGVLNLSILDGWWREGWRPDNSNGWGIPPAPFENTEQDAAEADALYSVLEQEVVSRYYERDANGVPVAWTRMAKEAIRTVAPRFSARRMLVEYIHRLYRGATGGAMNYGYRIGLGGGR
jgi:starch phosphorylase